MKTRTATVFVMALALTTCCLAPWRAIAEVPVRISVKFILDANGNRPATGSINQDSDVQDQVARSNEILTKMGSELRVELVEIVNVSIASQFYSSSSTSTSSRDDIRDAAVDDPAGYAWRTNAVNYYVNGSTSSAIADFPPDNDMILAGQNITDTTFLHELGHILSLYHTHETNGGGDGDACDDTIDDMSSWTIDDVSNSNFGAPYANLGAADRDRVDAVWNNVMSYHDANDRDFLTTCQMDRNSSTAWDDRNWMLTRRPIYVDASAGAGGNSGSWSNPFSTLDEAIEGGSLVDRVIVLLTSGSHALTRTFEGQSVEIVSRRGPATVQRPDVAIWDGAVDPGRSKNTAVETAMSAAQAADSSGDHEAALSALREGERRATGKDRIAIRLELAQRLRQARKFDESIRLYELVAEEGDEAKLRDHAKHWAARVKKAKSQSQSKSEQ